jgi:hypothetical protein
LMPHITIGQSCRDMISCTEYQDYPGGFEEENIENYTLET